MGDWYTPETCLGYISSCTYKFSDMTTFAFFCGSFFFVLCLLCFCARLFICALWTPAGKELTSWLSFVVSNCEFVTFPLVSWVSVVLDCIDS